MKQLPDGKQRFDKAADDHLVERFTAKAPVPTESDLLTLVRRGKVEAAADLIRGALAGETGLILFDEDRMTTMARFVGRDHGADQAAEALRLVTVIYPDSARAHENLGDLLAAAERVQEAVTAWTRALALIPDDEVQRRVQLQSKVAKYTP